ncbi:MAG: hypothetical protein QOG85_2219 [Gaiellaceae bacterium]|jgi:hypothetical protein|nr:hypothetical protein [Gaiellaceae bacterium]
MWEGVDRLLDRLDPQLIGDHGLGPLAARRYRERGEELPERIFREERAARAGALVAPVLLARVRNAYDGRLLLLKGPELTRRYPGGARTVSDLDVVAEDAEAAQAALLAAGFQEVADTPPLDYARHHHLHPLVWPGLALPIEVHRRPMWPAGLPEPSLREVFDAATPAELGVDGLLVPHRHHHALLVAAHAWGEVPMRKARELVDVLALVDDDERGELSELARRWRFERPWRKTLAAADWLLRGGSQPFFLHTWGRHLRNLREPTVLEMHLQEWLAPFSLAPPRTALRLSAAALLRDIRPQGHENWSDKGRRAVRAALHPLAAKSSHEAGTKVRRRGAE